MTRKFTKYPKKRITASYGSTGQIVISKSKLTQQFIDTFNEAMGGGIDGSSPDLEYYLSISIVPAVPDEDGAMVDIEAETYFDQNETMDYYEYKSLVEEFGDGKIMSKDEYYQDMYNQPTLVDKMNKVIQAYNPDWYFELYDACHIQAYLDNCILEP